MSAIMRADLKPPANQNQHRLTIINALETMASSCTTALIYVIIIIGRFCHLSPAKCVCVLQAEITLSDDDEKIKCVDHNKCCPHNCGLHAYPHM